MKITNNPAMILAEKTNYLNKDIVYLKNLEIIEYDIKSAGFSVIKYKKLMPEEEIKKLEEMPKEERNIYIGKRIIKEPKINEEILTTLEKVRKAFVYSNRINAENILSIKKDAIFVIKKQVTNLKFQDYFLFRKKGAYSSYLYINGKEFYYDSSNDILEVKGLSDEIKEQQKDFLLKDIRRIMKSSEKISYENFYLYLKKYRSKYLNRELPIECYRSLSTGKYKIGDFELDSAGEDELPEIDIEENYINYLLPLIRGML